MAFKKIKSMVKMLMLCLLAANVLTPILSTGECLHIMVKENVYPSNVKRFR